MNQFLQSQQGIEQAFDNEYYNIQFIGKGAFSIVFKAKNSKTHEVVAIKVIDLTILDAEVIPYMKNEVDLLLKSKNENVIRLIDHKITDHTIFLILEFCQLDVATMSRKYFSSKVPEDLAIIILRQIANGLHYLHSNNIIHRDLKLENFAISMTPEDHDNLTSNKDLKVFYRAQFKLIDFGLSKQFTSGNETTKTWAGSELNMGINYCKVAPEILEEQPYTLQADMYSFGVCLFLIVTGKFPYFEQAQRTKQQDLIKEGKADFNLIQKPLLRGLIQKMLIYDPLQRLTWKEMYEHELFTNQIGQILTPLDLRLQQNSRIYKVDQPKISEESQQSLQFVQKYKQQQEFGDLEVEEVSEQRKSDYKSTISQYQQKYFHLQKATENPFNIYQPSRNEEKQITECLLFHNRLILCVRTASKLQSLCETVQIHYKRLSYYSMQAEYAKFIDFLMQLSKQIECQVQTKISSMELDYGIYQEFKTMKEQIRKDPIYLQIQSLAIKKNTAHYISCLALKARMIATSIECLQQDDPEYEMQQIEVNIQMYKLILKMLQDVFYKSNQYDQIYNDIKCLLYQCLINIARLRYVLQNYEIEDQKLEEIEINNYKNQPDKLSEKVTELLEKYQLNYEIQTQY